MSMSTTKITVYKRTTEGSIRSYEFDPLTTKLNVVRDVLTKDGFLPPDDSDVAFRFVAAQSESSNMQDALINRSVENLVPLSGVLGHGNQLIATNYLATKKPDLIGIGTDWFFNRYLGVKISL